MLRIGDVYPLSEFFFNQDPESRKQVKKVLELRIRIRIKEFKYINQKIVSQLDMIWDAHPGSGS